MQSIAQMEKQCKIFTTQCYLERIGEEEDRVSDRRRETGDVQAERVKARVERARGENREVGEKGLFKGPSGSNVAFIGLLSAKHWSRAPR